MEIVLYAIPFITSIILFALFRKQATWWEYVLVIVPSLLFAVLTKAISVSVRMTDTEYLGGYVTKVRHYDDWDEWIERRCTREVPVGRDKDGNTIYETETYDCSYREYHPERWTYFSSFNYEASLYEREFNAIRMRFGSPMVFVDMHRHYYTKDGDAQDYFWLGTENTIRTLTIDHQYENRVRCSKSIFKLDEISKEDAKEYGLFDYPKISSQDQLPVLSKCDVLPLSSEIDAIKYINGYYGAKHQIRLFILLFDYRKGIETAFKQQSYWDGGNKNELVICLGVKPDRKIDWCYVFSWEDAPEMAVNTKNFFLEQQKLDLFSFKDWAIDNLHLWHRKEFKDFKYIKVDMTKTGYIILLILVLLYNIGISIFVILNEHQNEGFD